jgi:hypothetical protein
MEYLVRKYIPRQECKQVGKVYGHIPAREAVCNPWGDITVGLGHLLLVKWNKNS